MVSWITTMRDHLSWLCDAFGETVAVIKLDFIPLRFDHHLASGIDHSLSEFLGCYRDQSVGEAAADKTPLEGNHHLASFIDKPMEMSVIFHPSESF